MKARLRSPSDEKLKQNIDGMQVVLDDLMINRTVKSRTIDVDVVLVNLPLYEIRKIIFLLSDDQRKIL